MPQVTLSVPNEKLPLFKDLLQAVGIENKRVKENKSRFSYKNPSYSMRDSANAFFKKYFSWEYYSNELEFE